MLRLQRKKQHRGEKLGEQLKHVGGRLGVALETVFRPIGRLEDKCGSGGRLCRENSVGNAGNASLGE
jgi:hypothetical protein